MFVYLFVYLFIYLFTCLLVCSRNCLVCKSVIFRDFSMYMVCHILLMMVLNSKSPFISKPDVQTVDMMSSFVGNIRGRVKIRIRYAWFVLAIHGVHPWIVQICTLCSTHTVYMCFSSLFGLS